MTSYKSVHSALRPILCLSRLVGVYPHTKRKEFKSSLYMYTFLYFLILTGITISALFLLQKKNPGWYGSLIYLLIEKAEIGVIYSNYLMVLVTGIKQRGNLEVALQELSRVDKELLLTGRSFSYAGGKLWLVGTLKYLCLGVVICLDFAARYDTVLPYNLMDLAASHGPLISIYAQQLQSDALLHYLADHFAALRNRLTEQPQPDRTHRCLRLYDTLVRTSRRLNEVYAKSAFFSLASIFFVAIVTLHMLVTPFSYRHAWSSPLLILYGLSVLCLRMFEMWTVIQPNVNLTSQINDFNAFLCNTVLNDTSGRLYESEKIQTHVSIKRYIKFTACGFFPLDFSVAHSMIGAVTTFLVILVQFDAGS